MGRALQKRLVRKLELERFISKVPPYSTPKPSLEQYTIPSDLAATMLYIAAYANDDIIGKTVLDLGCGTGRLALGAAFLGAKRVVGVDLDRTSLDIGLRCSADARLQEKTQWVAADISVICGLFDTILQNPPYGVQTHGADRRFLAKALEAGRTVYSLHKSINKDKNLFQRLRTGSEHIVVTAPSNFHKRFVEEKGGEIKTVFTMMMTIPHMFKFHSKEKHEFLVDLYVLKGRKEKHDRKSLQSV